MCMSKEGDSSVQRKSEELIRLALNRSENLNLVPQIFKLSTGATISVDGYDSQNKVAVEIVSRIGSTSASRDKKIVSDAAKLNLLARHLNEKLDLWIVGCDHEFVSCFDSSRSKKWQAVAIQHLGVDIKTVDIDNLTKEDIIAAQARQSRGNSKAG